MHSGDFCVSFVAMQHVARHIFECIFMVGSFHTQYTFYTQYTFLSPTQLLQLFDSLIFRIIFNGSPINTVIFRTIECPKCLKNLNSCAV